MAAPTASEAAIVTINSPEVGAEYNPPVDAAGVDCGISISDAAATAGVSARTLRYYEELGLLAPSLHTRGG